MFWTSLDISRRRNVQPLFLQIYFKNGNILHGWGIEGYHFILIIQKCLSISFISINSNNKNVYMKPIKKLHSLQQNRIIFIHFVIFVPSLKFRFDSFDRIQKFSIATIFILKIFICFQKVYEIFNL